jgi:hypothetical protein
MSSVIDEEAEAGPRGHTTYYKETACIRPALTRTQAAGPSQLKWVCVEAVVR